MTTAIVERECKTAEELLVQLSANNRMWLGKQHFWAFRGHDDDAYELLPTSLRKAPPAELGYSFAPKCGRQKMNSAQIAAEFERLHEFYWTADAQGLPIPNDSPLLRTPEGWRKMKQNETHHGWPSDELLPLAALAQHYGIATRLLDWTQKPLVAAYFAACKAATSQKSSKRKHIAIWALNLDWVIHSAWPGETAKSIKAFIVTAPRASNPNLHAQGGIFTTEKISADDLDKPTTAIPLDQLVARRHAKMAGNQPTVMFHFRLRMSEAGKLLRLLHTGGVNAATLFPGYQGIAKSLAERIRWDKRVRVNFWLKEGFSR